MDNQTWLVLDDGCHQALPTVAPEDNLERVYRLYRFLTDLEDILEAIPDDAARLQAIMPRVRQLLTSSYWLQMEYAQPAANQGWAVNFLYREYEFPLTVQMVTWLPGHQSTIHNHATWGIVALIGGQEKNTLWRRRPTPAAPQAIEPVDEVILRPGDVIGFMPEAIHQVEPMGEEPTVSFNLYGMTDFARRYVFNPTHQTAELF
jgi:predicted metal-dependent enzyme (double-stranded beta helix superfamily)